MFGSYATELALTDLAHPAQQRVRHLSGAFKTKALGWVDAVFKKWKSEQADENGTVEIGPTGLLGLTTAKRVPMDQAQPFECAGYGVRNEIDLAFKLWAESYEDFERIAEEIRVDIVFALLAERGWRTAGVDSLARVSRLLWDFCWLAAVESNKLLAEVEPKAKKAERMLDPLNAGRITSAKVRTEKASNRNRQLWKIALDYFRTHPGNEVAEAVAYVRTFSELVAGLTDGGIARKIKGAKASALKSMGTR